MLSASQEEALKDPEKARRELVAVERKCRTIQSQLTEANHRLEAQAAVLKMLVLAVGGEIHVPEKLANDARRIHEDNQLSSEWRDKGSLLYRVTPRKHPTSETTSVSA